MKLTSEQLAGLSHIALHEVRGPAPGWNASVWIEDVCEGDDLAALFTAGLIVAEPAPEPHDEQYDEEAGSITCDHFYRLTAAGRSLIQEHKDGTP